MKKILLAILATVSLSAYSKAPIELVVPNLPGGQIDVFARQAQKQLISELGREVIVVNKPGGDGRIAVQYVQRQSATAPVFLVFSTGLAFNRILFDDPGYSYSDYEFIGPLNTTPATFAVSTQSGIRTVGDFITQAQLRPLNCGASNSASLLAGRYMMKKLKLTNVQIVPFKGSSELNAQLIGGAIDCAVDTWLAQGNLHRSGKIKVLAVGKPVDDIRTFSEIIPGFEFYNWAGIAIPVRNTSAVKSELVKAVRRWPGGSGNNKFLETQYKNYQVMNQTIND